MNYIALNLIIYYILILCYIIYIQYLGGIDMAADYSKILDKLVRLNRGMNLKLRDNTNILDVNIYNQTLLTLELESTDLDKHSEYIYNRIIELENVTMYIPSVYIKED